MGLDGVGRKMRRRSWPGDVGQDGDMERGVRREEEAGRLKALCALSG